MSPVTLELLASVQHEEGYLPPVWTFFAALRHPTGHVDPIMAIGRTPLEALSQLGAYALQAEAYEAMQRKMEASRWN